MSLNEILHSAISGLAASQAGLSAVSNNIANVGTAGYAREQVSLRSGVSSGRVSGVVIGEPSRVADKFLENAVYGRSGTAGQSEVVASYYDRLQALLGSPSSTTGLAARLSSISSAASEISSLQGISQTASVFTGNISDTLFTMDQLQQDVATLQSDVETEVSYTVDRVNVLLSNIHDLNNEVARLQGLGRSSAGSEDSRMQALEELSGLIDVTVREQPDGRVTIDTASGQVLLDKRLRQLRYPTGAGASQGIYPDIDIRFASDKGVLGASTGEVINSSAAGGKLGGMLEIRDEVLPNFSEQLGVLFSGLAQSLNATSNEGTTFPPPNSLTGIANGLISTDRLGFTGFATFAVANKDGALVQKVDVDFDTLGPTATVDDVVAAINMGLSPAATASFTDGVLSITANDPNNGIAIAQDPTSPSGRAGVGFSQFFGLNNIIVSDDSALTPSGFTLNDPHGFTTGETTQIILRDTTGRTLASYTMSPSDGGTFVDLVDQLNSSPLGDYGSFSMDEKGNFVFSPTTANAGATLSIPSDSTQRYDTGRSFSALAGLSGSASGLHSASVRTDIMASTDSLPLARLQLTAAVGEKAIGSGDTSGASAFVDRLSSSFDFGKAETATIATFASNLLGGVGTSASLAQAGYSGATERLDDAVNRRDSYSGVNVDEELAQMVVLQNSYTAAARVMTTASEMYDELLDMVR